MPSQGTALELLPHMVNELLIVSSLWGVLSSGELKNMEKDLMYVRRCRYKTGNKTYKTTHIAYKDKTMCGKELNDMWMLMDDKDLTIKDITCKECLRRLTNDNSH